ncbi:hypothetical protein DVH05_025206 [Phytophthora capsici]|nr:hypothetical protein DVH05_025206 [Phytophthora capsici]
MLLSLFTVVLFCTLAAAQKPVTKRYTALTPPLTLRQGEVTNTFHRLAIPKGPIAVYRFEAEVVEKDASGNVVPVPTYDAYLHHHVFGSTHKQYDAMKSRHAPMKPKNFSRSVAWHKTLTWGREDWCP